MLPEYRAEYCSLLERQGLRVDEAELKRMAERRQQTTHNTRQVKKTGGLGLRGKMVAMALWLTKRLRSTRKRQRQRTDSSTE